MRKLAIVLFALLGCAGNKPMAEQKANAADDPRCEEFYKLSDKKEAMYPEEFDELKKHAKESGVNFNKYYEFLEISFIQNFVLAGFKTRCNEVIICNQKEYCISFRYSNGEVWSMIEF